MIYWGLKNIQIHLMIQNMNKVKLMRKQYFAPVQNYINPYDINIWWYYIPGFNGYEISNTGIVRSMKHFRKYPFGIVIKPKEVTNVLQLFTEQFDDLTYELSDNYNRRQSIKRSELFKLAFNNPYPIVGYPRKTLFTDVSSRNQRCFIIPNNPGIPSNQQLYQVQFYHENDNDIKDTEVIKPIIFIERTDKDV